MPNTWIIRLDNNGIYLNDTVTVPYGKTNLHKAAFKFKPNDSIYWVVEEVAHEGNSRDLTIRVVDYNPVNVLSFYLQDLTISTLIFERVDWKKFEPLLGSYSSSLVKSFVYNNDLDYLKESAPNLFHPVREKITKNLEAQERVKFEDAVFGHQKISFKVKSNYLPLNHKEVEIFNEHLRPEFENIKAWFVKKLGKSFTVDINLIIVDNKLESVKVASKEIDSIDDKMINAYKVRTVLDLRSVEGIQGGKNLYRIEDLLSANDQEIIGSSISEILKIFVENGKVKNFKQLEYLARDIQQSDRSLKFTLKPLFGFLFQQSTSTSDIVVWELLNNHATYVWTNKHSVDNDNKLEDIVDEAIGAIINNGREKYKKYYSTLVSPTFEFYVIEHAPARLTEDERFEDWKRKLEFILLD
jgi:hypothetical protein